MKQPTTADEVQLLKDQIEKLTQALSDERVKRSEAEETAMALSATGQFIGANDELPTGRFEVVEKCVNPNERNEKKQKFINVELPTYYYTINLPTSCVSLSTNGIEYYHGQTYEFNQEVLAEMKDRSYKCWWHEKNVHGDNENAYRKQNESHLMTRAAAINRGLTNLNPNVKVM